MNEKNLEVLAELKKHLFGQTTVNKSVNPAKTEPVVRATDKPKAKTLAKGASKPLKQSKRQKNAAKKKKIQTAKAAAKAASNNPPKQKSKRVAGPKHTLISDGSKNILKPAKTQILINSVAEFKPKFDAKHMFNTPSWFHSGHNQQHPNQKEGRLGSISVRIGVDLGTAFTKVAVKIGLDTLIIDWSALTGHSDPNSRNLLPGIVAKTPNEHYCWQNFATNTLLTNLKLPLLDESKLEQCPVGSVAYLALVICYVRAAIYRHPEFGVKLAQRNIRWELNIGCATEPHDKIQIVKRMEHVALVAWHLASIKDLSENNIHSLWSENLDLAGLECSPQVVPEFIAQIASYLTSPQLKEGLHMLVDVGAATLDVATFNVVKNREEYSIDIPIFFSKVINHGTHFLNLHRHMACNLPASWDDTLPVPAIGDFAKNNRLDRALAESADSAFLKMLVDTILSVIRSTKTSLKGDPNSQAWQTGLPVFVTGGGAASAIYQSSILRVEQRFKEYYQENHRFRLVQYNMNALKYKSLKNTIDGRLTVAVGLTEDAESIARIIPSRDIQALQRVEGQHLDHQVLYAK